MTREEVRRLLGGYATGTLTAAEQQALFAAALDDQELFDELAREQALRDLLRDPAARAHLLASVEEKPRPWWRRIHRGALIGALAVAACVELAVIAHFGRPRPGAAPTLVAEVKPEPKTPAMPAPPPAEAAKPTAARRAASRKPEPGTPPRSVALKAEAASANKDLPGPAGAPALQAAAAPPAEPASAQVQANAGVPGTLGALGGAPPNRSQDARALFYAQPAFAQTGFLESQNGRASAGRQVTQTASLAAPALMVPNPGVKWTALRKQEDGIFSQVDPEQIKAGDIIKLRLVPNDNGYLSVMDGGKPLLSERSVVRLVAFETPEITGGAGKKELVVVLSRRSPVAAPDGEPSMPAPQAAPAGLLRPVAADQLSQADRGEHAVYEVKKGSNPLTPVLVRITLNFQ